MTVFMYNMKIMYQKNCHLCVGFIIHRTFPHPSFFRFHNVVQRQEFKVVTFNYLFIFIQQTEMMNER